MPVIELRRRTILADARARASGTRVRVGLDATSAASAAAAAAASSIPGSASGPTPEQIMASLDTGIACLKKDVALDACNVDYGPQCEGTDPETDQVAACLKKIELGKSGELTPVDWRDALTCAGVEPSEENKAKFADCVKVKETAWHSVERGTLGKCAMAVRRGLEGSAFSAHSTLEWRNGFETWAREFDVFRQKWEGGGSATSIFGGGGEVGAFGSLQMSDVARYATSYNTFRRQFVDAGGTTSCQEIETPGSFPWLWVGVGAVVLAVVSIVIWQVKTVASLARGAG